MAREKWDARLQRGVRCLRAESENRRIIFLTQFATLLQLEFTQQSHTMEDA